MNPQNWLIATLLALVPLQDGYAQAMHRCLGAHGEPVFSDRPCNAGDSNATAAGAVTRAQSSATLIRGRCAASTTELRDLVIAAMQSRDAIAFSGLILWHPAGAEAAQAQLRRVATLAKEPLQSAELELATDSADLSSSGEQSLLLRTLRNAERVPQMAETRYALIDRDGCWWLAQ